MSAYGTLRIACADLDARPLFWTESDGSRYGYEPDAAELVFAEAGYRLQWAFLQWKDFLPSVADGSVDGVWCGMGIIPERQAIVDFTDPYTVFNESVVMREGTSATSPAELAGLRIGAIADSANMRLARTFTGVELVPFDGATDDVVMVPLGDEPDLRLAFTVQTRNPWGMGVRKGNDEVRERINAALTTVKADGRLLEVWQRWLPANLTYPF